MTHWAPKSTASCIHPTHLQHNTATPVTAYHTYLVPALATSLGAGTRAMMLASYARVDD